MKTLRGFNDYQAIADRWIPRVEGEETEAEERSELLWNTRSGLFNIRLLTTILQSFDTETAGDDTDYVAVASALARSECFDGHTDTTTSAQLEERHAFNSHTKILSKGDNCLLLLLFSLKTVDTAELGRATAQRVRTFLPLMERRFEQTSRAVRSVSSSAEAVALAVETSLHYDPFVTALRRAVRYRVIEPCLVAAEQTLSESTSSEDERAGEPSAHSNEEDKVRFVF